MNVFLLKQKYSERILRTGKDLNVIQQCEKQVQWPPLENIEYLAIPENYEPLIEKVRMEDWAEMSKPNHFGKLAFRDGQITDLGVIKD